MKAIYQELRNSRVHLAGLNGEPYCVARNLWKCDRASADWAETDQKITCYHCLLFLNKLEGAKH